jgi:hypothetical protein
MQHTTLVSKVHRPSDLGQRPSCHVRRFAKTRHGSLQIRSFDQPHREERLPVALAHVKNRHDVGMIETGGSSSAMAKTLDFSVGRELCVAHELERDRAVKARMMSAVDDAAASDPEPSQDLVVTEDGARISSRLVARL